MKTILFVYIFNLVLKNNKYVVEFVLVSSRKIKNKDFMKRKLQTFYKVSKNSKF